MLGHWHNLKCSRLNMYICIIMPSEKRKKKDNQSTESTDGEWIILKVYAINFSKAIQC